MPIKRNRIVHTGPNTQPGGLSGDLASAAYHVGIAGALKYAPIKPVQIVITTAPPSERASFFFIDQKPITHQYSADEKNYLAISTITSCRASHGGVHGALYPAYTGLPITRRLSRVMSANNFFFIIAIRASERDQEN